MKSALFFLILCCVLFLSEHSFALESSGGSLFQIEQSLDQLLGEQNAVRYQEILSPEKLNSATFIIVI